MKQSYDSKLIEYYVKAHKIDTFFDNKKIKKSIIEYEKGEFLSSPFLSSQYIQFIIDGEVDIHFIREDGTLYSLATCHTDYMIGEQQLFLDSEDSVYAMALTHTTCIAISIDNYREELLNDNAFLRKIAHNTSQILATITMNDASSSDLESRVHNYMKYRCKDGGFTGLEKTAFHLHCSPRQLQRVMNRLESSSIVIKTGKGAYKLIE